MALWMGQTAQSSTGARKSVLKEEPTNLKPYQATTTRKMPVSTSASRSMNGPQAAGTQP
jgi:hypothetical protein